MNKTMFRGLILILLSTSPVCASEMNWSFKSPAFHYGNGYSTHVLSVSIFFADVPCVVFIFVL